MTEMMSGMATLLKDVVKELKELKQTPKHSLSMPAGDSSGPIPDLDDFNYPRQQTERTSYYRPVANDQAASNARYNHQGAPIVNYNRNVPNGHLDYSPWQDGPSRLTNRAPRHSPSIKLAPFTGKEDWPTWIARFEAIAERYGWGDEDRLDQLLPRIEGQAGEFVFTQLPFATLKNYGELISELDSRYKKIETARSFAAKFSRRSQKYGETAEEYAADLKRLYDKAHGYRDRRTRAEDLVRRFLDGLLDDDIRFEVEYHKEPHTIDEAVFHVVNLIQTKKYDRKNRGSARRTQVEEHEDTDAINRMPNKQNTDKKHRDMTNTNCADVPKSISDDQMKMFEQILQRIDRLEKVQKPKQNENRGRPAPKDIECFHCHERGHYARNCPAKQSDAGSSEGAKTNAKNNNSHLNSTGPTLVAEGRSQ
jgi:hypothetical protein